MFGRLCPSAPPLNELMPLQAMTAIQSNEAAAAHAEEMKKHNYSGGADIENAYTALPVSRCAGGCSSTEPLQRQPPPCFSPPMPYGGISMQEHKLHYQSSQQQQQQKESLLDGYGYAVPSPPPLVNNGNDNSERRRRFATLYCCRLGSCRCKLKNFGMFCIAFVEFCISALLLTAGVWCLAKASNFCPFYSALWTSVLCVVSGLVGMVASKMDTTHLHVAYLVLCLLSLVLAIGGAMVATGNWLLIGLYFGHERPILRRDSFYCLLGEYDRDRVKLHVMSQHESYFNKCLFHVKLGISINTVQLMFTVFLAFLFALSAILCARKLIIAARKR